MLGTLQLTVDDAIDLYKSTLLFERCNPAPASLVDASRPAPLFDGGVFGTRLRQLILKSTQIAQRGVSRGSHTVITSRRRRVRDACSK